MSPEDYSIKCYLLGRYLEYYKDNGTYENEANSLITEGLSFRERNIKISISPSYNDAFFDAIDFLTHMIARDEIYDSMDRIHCPILLYTSTPICYGVLNSFIYNIADELDKKGYLTEIFDLPTDGVNHPERLLNRRFKAVIGIHTEFFSTKIEDNIYFHDKIKGPKFLILLDHPGTFYKVLTDCPSDLNVITIDKNYQAYVERFFPKVKNTFVIPPGGTKCKEKNIKKDISLSFVGSYHNYREWLPALKKFDEENNRIGTDFIKIAEQHLDFTFEKDLSILVDNQVKQGLRSPISDEEFAELYFRLVLPRSIVLSKTREKIIKSILDDGLELHVYGDSWKSKIFEGYKNLIVHSEVTPEQSLEIYARSKISLNIMSWHKAGMTERLANIMLNHSVVITDESEYLEKHYNNNKDLIMFNLNESDIQTMPKRINFILNDDKKCKHISENAYNKASKIETWEARVNQLLSIINSIN